MSQIKLLQQIENERDTVRQCIETLIADGFNPKDGESLGDWQGFCSENIPIYNNLKTWELRKVLYAICEEELSKVQE